MQLDKYNDISHKTPYREAASLNLAQSFNSASHVDTDEMPSGDEASRKLSRPGRFVRKFSMAKDHLHLAMNQALLCRILLASQGLFRPRQLPLSAQQP